jgi:argininosuccinate lyase
MAQLWGGRFTKETDKLVYNFNASISFDQKFYKEDIAGSKAHVCMLGKQGILTKEEMQAIVACLDEILADVEAGKLAITDEYEDIHSFVEANLIDRLGDTGKKLHTGRSRNDQVALDMRFYTRTQVLEVDHLLAELLAVILRIMKENTDTIMPGFTHLQKAQPITLAHHMGAYFEMFKRDRSRMKDIYERMNYCPLGSGALAGTTYPLDREYSATLLGFYGPTLNSMDGVSDRDYLIEFLSAMSTIMMHLSRFSEEIIIWNSNEYRFVEIDDAYSTGSSIMPQKKNPDIAELVRGKTGRVYGALMSLLTTMKGIPLAYNKDMQEDKELSFDAIDTTKGCIALFTGMLDTLRFNKDVMRKSASHGFTNATDAADYLVNHGVPFRDAHGIIGRIVLYCIDKQIPIDEMSLEELKTFSPVFEKDIYDAISMETCVNKRLTIGAPGEEAMKQVISVEEAYLASNEGNYLGQIYAEPHKSYENVMYAGASPISEADS